MSAPAAARPHRVSPLLELGSALLLVSGTCAFFWWLFGQLDTQWGWSRVRDYSESLWKGWRNTLWISLGSLVVSSVIAVVLVTGLRSALRPVRWFCRCFVELVRGMPLLTLVLIGYYVVFAQSAVSRAMAAVGLGDRYFTGVLLLSVFTGAYLCEILRGGLESIPQGQIDSGRAVGFDRWQLQRYVILPQAMRRVLPALAGQLVSLVKDSSLLCVIGQDEFTYQARAFNSATYGGIEAFVPLAAGYLALTLPISAFAHWLEARFKYKM